MVSEFIEEKDGYLALSDEQYEYEVANGDEHVDKSACAILEIGEQREGYWNNDRFMGQMEKAVKIAEVKYPSSQGYRHIWCLDHSCGHTAFGDDALIANKMSKGPGGKQPKMREIHFYRVVVTDVPKFHCELNPIERVWSQSKRYTRAHTDYTIASLRRSFPEGLKSVSKENIANYVRRCRKYMFAYLEGSAVGGELEERIKFYKSVNYTSHRRVGMND